jgi:hypothetical protein
MHEPGEKNTGVSRQYGTETNCTHEPKNRTQEQVANTEQRQIASTNLENRTQEQVANTVCFKLHAQTQRTEHRSKLLIWNGDKLHAQIQRTEHRSKSLIWDGDKNISINPENRAQEQVANTARRRLAREQPGVWRMRHYDGRKYSIKWQQSLMSQMAHTYIISLAGYGMENANMGVSTLICPVQQDLQERNVVWMVFCYLTVPILTKM